MVLFVVILFNDSQQLRPFCNPQMTEWSTNYKLEMIWKRSWHNSSLYPGKCLKGLTKTTEDIGQESQSPGRDLNRDLPIAKQEFQPMFRDVQSRIHKSNVVDTTFSEHATWVGAGPGHVRSTKALVCFVRHVVLNGSGTHPASHSVGCRTEAAAVRGFPLTFV